MSSAGTDYERLCVCGHTFEGSHRTPGTECAERDCECGRFQSVSADYERLRQLAEEMLNCWTDDEQELARGVLALLGELVAVREERDTREKWFEHVVASWKAEEEDWIAEREAAERERDTLREALRRIADVNTDDPIRDAAEHRAAARAAFSTVDTENGR